MKNILMNKEMTKAILDGRKTQTRRVGITASGKYIIDDNLIKSYKLANQDILKCGKYQKGDVVWVREPAKVVDYVESNITMKVEYVDGEATTKDIPERFLNEDGYIKASWIKNMQGVPNGCIKEMARIFLKITDVSVKRLQDITIGNIINEGIKIKNTKELIEENMLNLSKTASSNNLKAVENAIKNSFIELWNKTAPKGYKWEDNPYVFVYEFERIEK